MSVVKECICIVCFKENSSEEVEKSFILSRKNRTKREWNLKIMRVCNGDKLMQFYYLKLQPTCPKEECHTIYFAISSADGLLLLTTLLFCLKF